MCCVRLCRYLALVTGRLGGSGVIDHAISGVPSVSLFRVEAHMPSGRKISFEVLRCRTREAA